MIQIKDTHAIKRYVCQTVSLLTRQIRSGCLARGDERERRKKSERWGKREIYIQRDKETIFQRKLLWERNKYNFINILNSIQKYIFNKRLLRFGARENLSLIFARYLWISFPAVWNKNKLISRIFTLIMPRKSCVYFVRNVSPQWKI